MNMSNKEEIIMSEFDYTYEDYLRDLAETEEREALLDDEFDYTYEDYLRDQVEHEYDPDDPVRFLVE